MTQEKPKILLCTVGGSHQPIVTAINRTNPNYVVFICSGKDPATGKPGSDTQILGKDLFIKENFNDEKPTLPNIPTQVGLEQGQYEVLLTQADDLDAVYNTCCTRIRELNQEHDFPEIWTDYTGGTKTMSAGLVCAALEFSNCTLQLVIGARTNLVKVENGLQFLVSAPTEQIRFQNLIAPYRQAWSRHAYSEAFYGLQSMDAPKNHAIRFQYQRFLDLSKAFMLWDQFNHKEAKAILDGYIRVLDAQWRDKNVHFMKLLVDTQDSKRTAAKLFDLYLNAQRKAKQGYFDDAIARVYRLLEWTAQWLLKTHKNMDTSNLSREQVPEHCTVTQNSDGRLQAGLMSAWSLVEYHVKEGESSAFVRAQKNHMLNHIKLRNNSLLAHGFEPITQQDWNVIDQWLSNNFIPMLLSEAEAVGIKSMPRQLPTSIPIPVEGNQ